LWLEMRDRCLEGLRKVTAWRLAIRRKVGRGSDSWKFAEAQLGRH